MQWRFNSCFFLQLLCVACIGFIYEPANSVHLGGDHLNHTGVMYTTYTGFILIHSIFIIAKIIKDNISFVTIVLFALNGVWLFALTGILLTIDRIDLSSGIFHPRVYQLTMITISISCAFANAVVHALDAYFTYKRRQDF